MHAFLSLFLLHVEETLDQTAVPRDDDDARDGDNQPASKSVTEPEETSGAMEKDVGASTGETHAFRNQQ